MIDVGILFALISLVGWGVGDFLIQKSTRSIGVWQTSVYLSLFGTLLLAPFAWMFAPPISRSLAGLFVIGALVMTIGVWINFTSLKKGKLSVIQPVLGLELVFVALIGFFFLSEQLSTQQYVAVAVITLATILVSYTHSGERFSLENGVLWGLCGAVFIAFMDVIKGGLSQLTHPLFALFVLNALWCFLSLLVVLFRGEFSSLRAGVWAHPRLVFWQSALDNVAWIAFGFAVLYIPITVALAISENFILLSVILGIVLNKERLRWWQVIGVALSMVGLAALLW